MYNVRTVYPLHMTVRMLRKALDTKKVTITRWSNSGFSFLFQDHYEMSNLRLNGEFGLFAFMKGMENTRALNHKKDEWYLTTLYSEAKISIEQIIKAPSHEWYRDWITIKEYIHYILDRYYLLLQKNGYVTWDDIGFCNGIFIPKDASIVDITYPKQPKWSDELHRNEGLILAVS